MTVVHLYKLKPGASSAWNGTIKKHFVPAMAKLMQDGTVLAYGADEDILHASNAPNYAIWATIPNFGAYEKVIKATDAMFDSMPAAERDRMLTLHDPSAHSDFMVRALVSKNGPVKPGTLPYTRLVATKLKPGKMQEYRRQYEQTSKPVLDALVEKGTILGYSLDTVSMHTSEPGTLYELVSVASLDKLDAMADAFREATSRLTDAQRSERRDMMLGLVDMAGHRDGLMRAVVFAAK
jgi:hypothetical protein